MSKAMTSGTARTMDSNHINMISMVAHLDTPIPLMRLQDATARYLVKVRQVDDYFLKLQNNDPPIHHYSYCTIILSGMYLFSIMDCLAMQYIYLSTNALSLHSMVCMYSMMIMLTVGDCFVPYLTLKNVVYKV